MRTIPLGRLFELYLNRFDGLRSSISLKLRRIRGYNALEAGLGREA
jgi:hypothetical protein